MRKFLSIIMTLTMLLGICASLITVSGASGLDNPFTDVKSGKWYSEAVLQAYEYGIMQGKSADSFEPTANMTRAEMVTLISRLAEADIAGYGENIKFKDVRPKDWFSNAVMWASDKGLVAGYEDKTFKPNNRITRDELAKLFVGVIRFLNVFVPNDDTAPAKFNDAKTFQSWAKPYIEQLRKTGLVKGDTDVNFNAKSNASRAEVSQIAVRLYPYLKGQVGVNVIMDEFVSKTCPTHSQYHVFLGATADVNAEVFASYVYKWMKLDEKDGEFKVTVDEDDINALKEGYADEGFGDSEGGDIAVTLTDLVTGDSVTETIRFYCTKWPDAAGQMDVCPDDCKTSDIQEMLENLDEYFDTDDDGRIKIPLGAGATFTRENISDYIISGLGLPTGAYEFIIRDAKDSFDKAQECHRGICHGQTHAWEFDVAIKNLANSERLTHLKGEETEDMTEFVEGRLWFSKDMTMYYASNMPAAKSRIDYTGESDNDALTEAVFDYINERSEGLFRNEGFTPEIKYVFESYDEEHNPYWVVIFNAILYTDDFQFGNQAELDDTVITGVFRVYTDAEFEPIYIPANSNEQYDF